MRGRRGQPQLARTGPASPTATLPLAVVVSTARTSTPAPPHALPRGSLYSGSVSAKTPAAGASGARCLQTPAMQQYHRMKAEHPDALLFFRMGDFYELFFEDARGGGARAGDRADLALQGQGRARPSPCAACPTTPPPAYVARLVKQGFRVALCEQVEDPRTAKGVVQARGGARGHARHAARGARRSTASETSYVLALAPGEAALGAAWLDATTGEFFVVGVGRARALGAAARRARRHAARASSCVPRAAALPAWLDGSGRSPRRRSRAPELEDGRVRPAGAHARDLLAHFGGRDARGLRLRGAARAPPPRPAPRCATCATRRSATSPT